MDVSLIQVPFMAGDGTHPAARGPSRLVEAGMERLLGRIDSAVENVQVELPPAATFPDVVSASAAINQRLCLAVRHALTAGRLPIVLAGSCDAAVGVVSGLPDRRCGGVWIDAHGDFNTPESSISGFLPGMSLAIIAGHCHRPLWSAVGGRPPLHEADVVLIGVRSLSPDQEADRLRHSAVHVIPWQHGQPAGDIGLALDDLACRVGHVYLHIDNDALDPIIAPGVVDEPVAGGLTMPAMRAVIRDVATRFRIAAATIATYTPANDHNDKTLEADLTIMELLAEYAASYS
jgi:arginase